MADALLEDRLRLLGPDHPSTLDTRGHRAQLLSEAGRDAEAIAEMESLLADRIRVLGEADPVVASTRHNLAAVRSRSEGSDRVDAWWELQQNAAALSDELGPDHPATLVAWGLVAEQLQRLGRDAEALALLERLVEARTRVLGPDANQTLVSRRMMCTSQRRLGDVRQASAGAEELETLAVVSVGPTSPLVQQIRMELIECLRAVMAEGGSPDPTLTARLEELMDQVADADPEPEGTGEHVQGVAGEQSPQFPIVRRPAVNSVPRGGRAPLGAPSDNYFLIFSAAPSGQIEVNFLDTSDDVETDFSQRFEVDGSVLLPVLLEQEFGSDPDGDVVARRGAELGFDPSVWQDVVVTLYSSRSNGEVTIAREIAEAAGALVEPQV